MTDIEPKNIDPKKCVKLAASPVAKLFEKSSMDIPVRVLSDKNAQPTTNSITTALPWPRHIPVATTLVMFLVADVFIASIVDIMGGLVAGLILGVTFAQIVLLAVWTAMGPARLVSRTLTGFGGMILVSFALVACIDQDGSGDEGWLFFVIIVAQWVAIQFPFWTVRLLFRWRLGWPGEQVAATTGRDMQFGIGQLMTWMAFVAVTLGIARLLVPDDVGDSTSTRGAEEITIFTVLTIYNSLLAWPVVWSALAPRWWGLWLCLSVACSVGLTWAEIYTFETTMNQSGESVIFWYMNGVQVIAAYVALLTMRCSGFRLVRDSAKKA